MKNILSKSFDIVIIGAGIMGSAAAYYLSKTDKKILLIDQFNLDNNMNSSNDYSRVFRYEYGADIFYTKLAVKSLRLWKEIEKESKTQLYFNCGELIIGTSDKDASYAMEGYKVLKKLGLGVKFFDKKSMQKNYPQFEAASMGVLDINGGIIEAKTAVASLQLLAKKNGVIFLENKKVINISENSIEFSNHKKIFAKKIIVTAGIWVKDLIDIPIKITKQEIVYIKPNRKELFSKKSFPCFAYVHDRGYYGLPIHGIDAVKITNHVPGEDLSTNLLDRSVSKEFIIKAKDFLIESIPELATGKIVDSKVCFYDMTPDEDFIIDCIGNLIIGAGFSGHGFKFAPIVGKILTELALQNKTSYDISRFSLKRFK